MIPFRPSEIAVLRKKPRLLPSTWAEQNRYLKKGPVPGPWRNKRNPAMIGIVDSLAVPSVRVIVLMKGVQTGATDAVFNFLGREADYSIGTDSALVVLADEKSVKKHSENRLQPMIDCSASLRQLKSPKADDTGIYKIRLQNGFVIEIGWATSETSLASESYRIVILDEYDKYRSMVNAKEAESRAKTFEDRGKKIVKLSNPSEEGGPIHAALEECDIICDYHIPCPHCGELQVMQWDNFRWPGQITLDGEVTAEPKTIRRTRSAWYECSSCSGRWDDHLRNSALDKGTWLPRHPVDHPYAIGYWLPAWLSKFVPISEIVAQWLEAQDSPELLRAWYNKQAGLPFSTIEADEVTDAGLLHGRKYRWWPDNATWRVPQRACLLIGSVDTQDNRLEVKMVALGRGMETWVLDRYIIHGSPSDESTLQQLDEYLNRSWEHESGARLNVAAVGVDTGGHFTKVMYAWLRQRLGKRYFGIKGSSDHRAPLTRWSLPSRKQRRQIPLLFLNTCIIKNDIHSAYKLEEHGPRYIHFPDHLDFHYFEQLASEKPVDQRDKRGNKVRYWITKKPNGRNEALDLLVYVYGVAHYLNPDWQALENTIARQDKVKNSGETVIEKPVQSLKTSRRGGFVKGWK